MLVLGSYVILRSHPYGVLRSETCVVSSLDLCHIKSNDSHRRYPMRWFSLTRDGLVLYEDRMTYVVLILEDILCDVWLVMVTKCYKSPLRISYPFSDLHQHTTL